MADTSAEAQGGAAYEQEHVHEVYEQIATHFSATRYKPWPIVERFLKDLPAGAIGADVGCGNGKYMAVRDDVFIVGSDRSTNLLRIAARHAPHSAIVADSLSLPHPPHTFDFAISIAVIHHLSTPERRVEALRAVLELLREGDEEEGDRKEKGTGRARGRGKGKALIYVWALEQGASRRGWDEGCEQDVMVPWVLKQKREKVPKERKAKGRKGGRRTGEGGEDEDAAEKGEKKVEEKKEEEQKEEEKDQTFLRYYHLYREGELNADVEAAGGEVLESGYDRDNWWAVMARK